MAKGEQPVRKVPEKRLQHALLCLLFLTAGLWVFRFGIYNDESIADHALHSTVSIEGSRRILVDEAAPMNVIEISQPIVIPALRRLPIINPDQIEHQASLPSNAHRNVECQQVLMRQSFANSYGHPFIGMLVDSLSDQLLNFSRVLSAPSLPL